MAIRFIVTDAGRAALTNDDNTGTGAHRIAEVGLGRDQYTASDRTRTDLVDPIKRVDTIGGESVAPDTIHVTLQDETSDTYSVGEIGLFLDNGTLFAYFSQADDWIIEKAAPSTLLLATDIEFADIDVSSLTFGDAAFLNPPASETVQGVIEIATQDEVDAGTDRRRAVVPRTLKAFIDKILAAYATVKQLTDHAASRDHPGATTSAQGMVELATYAEAKEGKDNTRAVTPAADKAALDQHRGESGAHAADRISLASLSKLGNPKTAQAGFAALGSAAVRDEGAGNELDADKLDGLESEQFLRSDKGNTRIPFGTTSETNYDGLVYDEGDNTVAFYADQTVGTDTPRALLGPGYIELAGRRIANSGAGIEFANAIGIGVTPSDSKAFTNGSSIALGDDDSGIRGNGDGAVEVWANNKAMLTVTTAGLKVAQGALEFPGGLYAEDGSTYAINMANGDIVNANVIKWADESNNAIEGIAFPRNNSATDYSHFSTFRAYRDKPLFAPDASGSSHEMFHEGNLAESHRRDWGAWDTNGFNTIRNSGREVIYASDTEVRLGGSNFTSVRMLVETLFGAGARFGGQLNMQNNDILNANKVTINDEGSGEGFMLPSYGLVEKSGYAVLERISDGAEMWSTDGTKMNVKQTLQQNGKAVATEPYVDGKVDLTNANGDYFRISDTGYIDLKVGGDWKFRVTGEGRLDRCVGGIDASLLDGSAKLSGLELTGNLAMGNKDITGVNRIIINDDGANEGYMLPNYGFVETNGNAYVVGASGGEYDGSTHARFDSNGEIYAYPSGSAKKVWHDGDSKRTSSYVVFPNGLIIQWGNATATAGRKSVTTDFPIPFPNDCLIAVGCDNEDAYPDPVGIGWSRTQVSTTTDENGIVRYIAIGY